VVTPEQVKAVKVPTLGVVGSLDSALESMQDLAKLRPDMKFVIVEGASHTGPDGMQGRPELISVIREFISSQRKPDARQAAQ
jgi:pimeloyl-ACP methyl ester carboxylesterase